MTWSGVRRPVVFWLIALLLALPAAAGAAAPASVAAGASADSPAWVDWADLALASPVVLSGTIVDIDRLSRRDAPHLRPGGARVLVRVQLDRALKAPGILPAEAAWFWQGPVAARGRLPFAKQDRVLVFARPLSGGGDPEVQPLQLVSPHGQQPWHAAAEQWVRSVLQEAVDSGNSAGLMVTGVTGAFHTDGVIPGDSESQFFLRTAQGRPITLLVRQHAERPTEVLATSRELVETAGAVRPQTLLWRALACGLPAALPAEFDSNDSNDSLVADYHRARESIGPCGRKLTPPR